MKATSLKLLPVHHLLKLLMKNSDHISVTNCITRPKIILVIANMASPYVPIIYVKQEENGTDNDHGYFMDMKHEDQPIEVELNQEAATPGDECNYIVDVEGDYQLNIPRKSPKMPRIVHQSMTIQLEHNENGTAEECDYNSDVEVVNSHEAACDFSEIPRKNFYCQFCDYSSVNNIEFEIHTQTHISKKAHQCSQCDKIFALKVQLERHQKVHTGDKPYQCIECEKRFPTNVT